MTVLSDDKYFVRDMVIQDWHLVRRLHNPDGLNFTAHIRSPFRIGQNDFVIAGSVKGWHLVNVYDGTKQLLVNCNVSYGHGFCITTEEGCSFDFHFTSSIAQSGGDTVYYHHRLPFRRDIVDVLSKYGQIPASTLQEQISMIEKSKQT